MEEKPWGGRIPPPSPGPDRIKAYQVLRKVLLKTYVKKFSEICPTKSQRRHY